jgi:hypothetical protein
MNYIFLLFCAFWLPSMMIALGLVYIFKKDWAWRFVAWALKNVNPHRTATWDHYSTLTGVILIILGLAIISFLVIQLGS